MDDFHLTQEDVAKRVGKSRSAVANTLRLFHLPPSVQRLIAEGRLSAGHARALLGTPDRGVQERLADEAVREGWSVREVEAAVRALTQPAAEGTGAEEPAGTAPILDEESSDSTDEPRPGSVREPAVLELEELLSARLDTRVSVSIGSKRGRIVVEFADLDDLERIYRIITPPGSRAGE
jgi:ParB family chromosome partitioning protein